MKSIKLAIVIATAGAFTVSVASAQSPAPSRNSAYEYGNYDYYAQQQQGAAAAPSVAPTAAANTTATATGGESACGCEAEKSCGCDNGCDDCCKHHCLPIFKCHECCPLECEADEICRCFDDCCWLKERGMTLTGWLDGGIEGNPRGPADRFNGPVTFPDRDDGQLNQFWGVLERTTDITKNCGWFLGGRADFFWGSDFLFATAAGLDGTPAGNVPRWNTDPRSMYGFAMPQLYLETDYDDLKIKWGHFYTIAGYEVINAPGNFFYSHSNTHMYNEPFTHTGVLASRPWNDEWTWYAGIDNGWNGFNMNSRANFLGGLTYTQADWGSLAFAITTGDDSTNLFPGLAPFANRTYFSFVWTRNFTSRFTNVLATDCFWQQDANTTAGIQTAECYSITEYAYYKINCCWTFGVRAEIMRDDDGFMVTGLRPGNSIAGASFPGNFTEVTVGFNYKPNANLVIRPEVRWDFYNGLPNQNGAVPVVFPFDDGTRTNQFLVGIDAIYQF